MTDGSVLPSLLPYVKTSTTKGALWRLFYCYVPNGSAGNGTAVEGKAVAIAAAEALAHLEQLTLRRVAALHHGQHRHADRQSQHGALGLARHLLADLVLLGDRLNPLLTPVGVERALQQIGTGQELARDIGGLDGGGVIVDAAYPADLGDLGALSHPHQGGLLGAGGHQLARQPAIAQRPELAQLGGKTATREVVGKRSVHDGALALLLDHQPLLRQQGDPLDHGGPG